MEQLDLILSYLNWADSAVCQLYLKMPVCINPDYILTYYLDQDDIIGMRNVIYLFQDRWRTADLIETMYSAKCRNVLRESQYVEIYHKDIIKYSLQYQRIGMFQWLINNDIIPPAQMETLHRKKPKFAKRLTYPPNFTLA